MAYELILTDNFHGPSREHQRSGGFFDTLEDAVHAAQRALDRSIDACWQKGHDANATYRRWEGFGEATLIFGPERSNFDSYAYARIAAASKATANAL